MLFGFQSEGSIMSFHGPVFYLRRSGLRGLRSKFSADPGGDVLQVQPVFYRPDIPITAWVYNREFEAVVRTHLEAYRQRFGTKQVAYRYD